MDGFTKLPKMQHFKEGGSIQPERAQPKKMKEHKGVPAVSKKDAGTKAPLAFPLRGTAPDVEDKTTLTMKQGGRAKKAVGTVKKYKTGGGVKKFNAGGRALTDLLEAKELARLANARKYLGPAQQGQFAASEMRQTPAMTGVAPAPTPAPMMQAPGGMSPAGAVPAQKRGGKVKKGC